MENEILIQKLKEAVDGIEPQHGIWILEGFTSCTVNVGKVELKTGKVALVQIIVQADEEEIESECRDFDSLPQLHV